MPRYNGLPNVGTFLVNTSGGTSGIEFDSFGSGSGASLSSSVFGTDVFNGDVIEVQAGFDLRDLGGNNFNLYLDVFYDGSTHEVAGTRRSYSSAVHSPHMVQLYGVHTVSGLSGSVSDLYVSLRYSVTGASGVTRLYGQHNIGGILRRA